MKNVGELRDTLNLLSEQYEEMKLRYDQHAGFKIRLQNNSSSFVAIRKISETKICCENNDLNALEISTYPFYHSNNFARCLHVKCTNCGTAWVPYLDFDLNQYYQNEYANYVQPFRLTKGLFHTIDNPFWQSESAERMKVRAENHLSILGVTKNSEILEIGPGVGITLSMSPSKHRYAEELDEACRDILQSELSVKLIDTDNTNKRFDFIIASHMIEHLFIGDLISFLGKMRKLLKKGGKMLIEVPKGADEIGFLSNEQRRGILFEPHTVSFSTYGLVHILENCRLKVTDVSLDKFFTSLSIEQQHMVVDGRNILKNANLICVCEAK